jgi:GAF domain-containing protein
MQSQPCVQAIVSPEVVSPEVVSPEVVSPEVLSSEVLSPEAVSPEAVLSEAVLSDVVSPEAALRKTALLASTDWGLDTPDPKLSAPLAAISVADVIAQIRGSLDLETIFQTAATEVRRLLQADRVGVFRFYPELDWEGMFVSEDVAPGWTSALTCRVLDHCFSERFAPLYQQGRVNAIADIQALPLQACYRQILDRFEVRANMVAPLRKGDQLWGLLCIHQCQGPRAWTEAEVEVVRQIAEHLGMALQQSELLLQAQIQADQQKALMGVISRIRASLDLDTIFRTTATEVRQLLQVDRVGVFRFHPELNWEGEFVAEDVAHPWTSAMETRVLDHCFSERFAPQYQAGRVNAIADIYRDNYQDCYIQVLEQFQIRANVVAPLLQGNQLWGLLCIHQCSGPRIWEANEVDFVQQIAEQLSVALQQADYMAQMQAQATQLTKAAERERTARWQRLVASTITKIRQSLDLETIFQTTTQEIHHLLKVDRAVIYRFNPDWSGRFVAEAQSDGWESLMELQTEIPDLVANITNCSLRTLTQGDTYLQETAGGDFVQGTLYRIVPDVEQAGFSDCYRAILQQYQARAYAIAAIYHNQALWGLLAVYQNSGPRTWQEDEVNLLTQISAQLGVAIQQAAYVQQVQGQAAQLAKAAERQRALAATVEKIRRSLDIATIFQTTTQEVRQLLEVERVAIYRFHSNWNGELVADTLVSGGLPDSVPPQLAHLGATEDGQHPRHETFVPILHGESLWGLLVAYQTSYPRYWQQQEIDLLAQVAVQLGIAIQQAELLKQTQEQATELIITLAELKQSQTQLIHGEKMAGLGQLVAGVAHEINNPVNFIYGNLTHVFAYTEAMMELVALYQTHYPEPVMEIEAWRDEMDIDFMYQDLSKTLNSMKVGTERIRQIVLSLRNFSRIDEAQFKAIDIHEGIDSTLLILQHRLRDSADHPEIQIVKEYGDLPLVECYPAQLNQVFMNILSNAIDALIQPGEAGSGALERALTLRIRTEQRGGDRVAIGIADNGVGIPEEVRSRIFDPFFTTKPIGKGTGLGLSISYQIIVNKHNGSLYCTSEPGNGSEFWIEIPVRQAVASPATPPLASLLPRAATR